jgi:catechol 2,3-dioxygenase
MDSLGTGAVPYGRRPPGYRLPAATRVGAVRLRVNDLERSIAFYQGVLGLTARRTGADAAELTAREGRPLVWLHAVPGTRPAPRRGRFGLFHFAILLPERASLGRFIAHASRHVSLGAADHWVSEAVYLSDPDGLGIEVYADRPRHAWQHRAGELLMATDPLDLQGLVDAGGETRWDGAPPRTTLGHIHLHVGDLDAGAAFYHAALGLDATVWSYPGALFFAAGGYHHHLGTNTWSPGPAPAEDEACLLEWELALPTPQDASRAADSLRAGGFEADADAGGWVARDPWGTRLRLVSA